jgi:hypothetical protein
MDTDDLDDLDRARADDMEANRPIYDLAVNATAQVMEAERNGKPAESESDVRLVCHYRHEALVQPPEHQEA